MADQIGKATPGKVRLFAVMTSTPNWPTARRNGGIVAAFTVRAHAEDEMRDLRAAGERWWIQSGTLTFDKPKARSRKLKG